MLFLDIILIILNIIFFIIFYKNKKENQALLEEQEKIIDSNIEQQKIANKLAQSIIEKRVELSTLENREDSLNNQIANHMQYVENIKEINNNALEDYEKVLNNNYLEVEKEYDSLLKGLYNNYEEEQDNLLDQIKEEQDRLNYLRSTRIAAIQAQIKEKEIKEKTSFYCLQPTDNERDDIRALERVKPNLHQPRILCMLIWSTYFQKPMTALCNNVLGTKTITGIYKITNQETGECYIGQAIDVATRWKNHAKCGLGIDTPASNKLYKAMQEYGIWNFSWELLEECNKDILNEKESYYIELYDSCSYGYNSNIGIKKS